MYTVHRQYVVRTKFRSLAPQVSSCAFMRGSRKFVIGHQTPTTFFFFVFSYEGEGPKALHVKAGNHWHASETPFKLRFDGGLNLTRHGMLT